MKSHRTRQRLHLAERSGDPARESGKPGVKREARKPKPDTRRAVSACLCSQQQRAFRRDVASLVYADCESQYPPGSSWSGANLPT